MWERCFYQFSHDARITTDRNETDAEESSCTILKTSTRVVFQESIVRLVVPERKMLRSTTVTSNNKFLYSLQIVSLQLPIMKYFLLKFNKVPF